MPRDPKQSRQKTSKRRQSGGVLGKLFLLLVLVAAAGVAVWWFTGRSPERRGPGDAALPMTPVSVSQQTGETSPGQPASPVIRAFRTNGMVMFTTNEAPVAAPASPAVPPAANRLAAWPTNYTTPLPLLTNPPPPKIPTGPIIRVFSTNRSDSNVLRGILTPQPVPATNAPPAAADASGGRPVRGILEAQIALARQGISSGSFDGAIGGQTRAALRAFQLQQGLPQSGELDATTRPKLLIREPVFTNMVVMSSDLARLLPVSDTWLGKSQQPRLDHETLLELVAERAWSHPAQIRLLNPGVNWTNVAAASVLVVPFVEKPSAKTRAAFLRIQLSAKSLEAFDAQTNLLAHFPCSIAARVEKRPVGELKVQVFADGPDYTWNPEVFPESPESKTITRKLRIPPGPNNPVGTVWIGLDRPGYGIHGTPQPEQVGRTESHGCFRLANWNAEHLLRLVRTGTPVHVLP